MSARRGVRDARVRYRGVGDARVGLSARIGLRAGVGLLGAIDWSVSTAVDRLRRFEGCIWNRHDAGDVSGADGLAIDGDARQTQVAVGRDEAVSTCAHEFCAATRDTEDQGDDS